MAPWKLPLIVFAIAAPITLAFGVGGPGVGVAIGALAAVGIIVAAATQRPRGPISSAPRVDRLPHLLVVVCRPVDDAATVAAITSQAAGEDSNAEPEAEVLVLAPARIGFLDRWASDVEGARREAQRSLVITVASLAKAGVAAEARVGDEDIVQAVEDQLQSFPATAVLLATASPEQDPDANAAAQELRSRLDAEFHHLPR